LFLIILIPNQDYYINIISLSAFSSFKTINFINQKLFFLSVEILQLKGVTKEFNSKVILDRVSLSIEEGDIFGIIGQSGSGKTTLLNLLIGFYEPNEGKILYQSDPNKKPKEIHKKPLKIKRKFGFATQTFSFYPKLTITENLFHFGKLYGLRTPILKTNTNNLLEFTKLKKYQNKLAEEISVGMQKRLDLSCALIHKPKIILLDEPTANIDSILQKEIIHLIKQVNKLGITIIIASHHLNDIEKICNKVALIHKGKITICGAIEEIKQPYLQKEGAICLKTGEYHQKLIRYVKNLPLNKIIDKGDSLVLYSSEIQTTLQQLISLAQKENITFQDINIKKPSLQDIFESIIKEKESSESQY